MNIEDIEFELDSILKRISSSPEEEARLRESLVTDTDEYILDGFIPPPFDNQIDVIIPRIGNTRGEEFLIRRHLLKAAQSHVREVAEEARNTLWEKYRLRLPLLPDIEQLASGGNMEDCKPISVKELSKLVNVPCSTLYRWAQNGKIPPIAPVAGGRGKILFDPRLDWPALISLAHVRKKRQARTQSPDSCPDKPGPDCGLDDLRPDDT
jgi:excisionase family DNA binding protein